MRLAAGNPRYITVVHGVAGRWVRTSATTSSGVAGLIPTGRRSRYRVHGWNGLQDRSSRLKSCPDAPGRSLGFYSGPAGHPCGTWTRPLGSESAPPKQPLRYERGAPGDMIHVDVKKLGRTRKIAAAGPTLPRTWPTTAPRTRNWASTTSTSPWTTTPASRTPTSCPT